jgi:hypothetical protein
VECKPLLWGRQGSGEDAARVALGRALHVALASAQPSCLLTVYQCIRTHSPQSIRYRTCRDNGFGWHFRGTIGFFYVDNSSGSSVNINGLKSVLGLVSTIWYRIPFDQSELSISNIPPTDSPTV